MTPSPKTRGAFTNVDSNPYAANVTPTSAASVTRTPVRVAHARERSCGCGRKAAEEEAVRRRRVSVREHQRSPTSGREKIRQRHQRLLGIGRPFEDGVTCDHVEALIGRNAQLLDWHMDHGDRIAEARGAN